MGPEASIQKTADVAQRLGSSKDVVRSILDISKKWQVIPNLADRKDPVELTDQILNQQMHAFYDVRNADNADPKALADAICGAALHGK